MTRSSPRDERGQAAVLLLGAVAVLLLGALVLAAFGQALGARGRQQRAADLAAMSAARAMGGAFPRLFELAELEDGRPNPRHLSRADYVALAERTAIAAAGRNGVRISAADVRLPDEFAPTRVTVVARGERRVRMATDGPPEQATVPLVARATAEIGAGGDGLLGMPARGSGGGYDGPLAYRMGKPSRWLFFAW
jgi:Putative Flp pilus-assembly TadE/G-like